MELYLSTSAMQSSFPISEVRIPCNRVQARVLREFSPEEVTANIYTMVDVLLHHIQVEMHAHALQVMI